MVDAEIGAEPLALRRLLVRSGGGDDAGAERLGERDRGRADAGGSAVHEQGFAGFQRPAGKDICPDGEIGLRDRRRLDCGEAGGNRQGVGLMRDAVVGVAAAGNQRRDARAQAVNSGVRSERHHLAGDFQPKHVGDAGRRRVMSLALVDVGSIDARGFDPNENLARPPGPGGGASRISQRLRTARWGATTARMLSLWSAT